MKTIALIVAFPAALALLALSARAQSYTVAYTNGGSWNTVYAQGFSTALGASPDPGLAGGSPVDLTEFDFYKSGTADSAANIQLAIFNTMYPDLTGMTTSSSSFVGLSANTIASTASISTGATIAFTFDNLQLAYDTDYSAYFVNVGAGGALTPVLVSALTANYELEGDGNYHPVPNYGTDSQYQYTTGNYISGGYLQAFNYAGDADFTASLIAVPEPATGALFGLGTLLILHRHRRLRRPGRH